MNKRLNIVIPMAGAGSRFLVEGYDLPKPFIDIKGKMMIERVLGGLGYPDAKKYVVVQEKFLKDNQLQMQKLMQVSDLDYITVKTLTQGASCTALAAFDAINNDDAVVFADADNIFNDGVLRDFIGDALKRNLDASLVTFNSSSPAYSYIELDDHGFGIRTREKEVISSHAISGLYYFASGRDYIRCAIEMMIYGDKVKNEYYLSNAYNYLIAKGKRVGIHEITSSDWDCVGTPELLKEYVAKLKDK